MSRMEEVAGLGVGRKEEGGGVGDEGGWDKTYHLRKGMTAVTEERGDGVVWGRRGWACKEDPDRETKRDSRKALKEIATLSD